MLTREETLTTLHSMAEEGYQSFQKKLIPGQENILGVRQPALKKLAKDINRGDWRTWLTLNREALGKKDVRYEEIMLYGLVLGGNKTLPIEEYLSYIKDFLPFIDNWAVCDGFCASLKRAKKERKEFWDFIGTCLESREEYTLRFSVVMLLDHYIEAEYLENVFAHLDGVDHESYYVKMAVAWAVSICYIKYPKETQAYLDKTQSLDTFTYNKAIQKICESTRVSALQKEKLKQKKR